MRTKIEQSYGKMNYFITYYLLLVIIAQVDVGVTSRGKWHLKILLYITYKEDKCLTCLSNTQYYSEWNLLLLLSLSFRWQYWGFNLGPHAW
jgi:hypothetical protein